MITLDSNIWIYYLDPTVREHEHVSNYVEDLIRNEQLLTAPLYGSKCPIIYIGQLQLKRKCLSVTLSKLLRLSSMHVVDFDMELYFETIRLLGEFRHDRRASFFIGGRDASIVAMMKKYNVKTIVTHDTDFIKLADKGVIQIYDPIPSKMK